VDRAVESGDEGAMVEALTEDCDFLSPGGPLNGAKEAAAFAGVFMTAFPDARFEFQAWVESGDTAAAEGKYWGTHTGTLASPQGDIAATGKSVTIPFAAVTKVRDGRVSYHHAYWDNAAFMMQLGLMPSPGG
jgi:predicted ester cyclase